MTTARSQVLSNLTAREKAALRLLGRGYDAKSAARELGVSVNSVNERLREARRKLGVSSSREAARLLTEIEARAAQESWDEKIGLDGTGSRVANHSQSKRRQLPKGLLLALPGACVMLAFAYAMFLMTSPAELSLAAPAVVAREAAPSPARPLPLMAAVERGDIRAVERLLAANSDPNVWHPGEGTPLISAVRRREGGMVRLLLDHGADPNFAAPGDGSPLIAAAAAGDTVLLEELIARGADVDAVVAGDETALIAAARSGRFEAAKALVAHGADVNLAVTANADRAPERRSPLSQATAGGHDTVSAFLKARGAKS